jgi:uncharacterized membrane protein YhhN
MAMVTYVFLVAGLLVALFIVFELRHQPVLALFLKGLASFGFIAVMVSVVSSKMLLEGETVRNGFLPYLPIAFLLLLGLVAGLLGDLYLALRPLRSKIQEPNIILGGVAAFSVGHLFYFVALLILGTFSFWAVVFSFGFSVLIYLSAIWMKLNWEKSKIPCMVYSFLIFLMIGQAFANAVQTGFQTVSTLMFAGAVLFGISDLILSQIYFKGQNDNKGFIIANLSTYYLAQLLLALSLMFI